MAAPQHHSGPSVATSNPEQAPWAREVAASLATRPSRASSLISTRTRFSTTTIQEDAKSIDLSISGHHFRISRDGSQVTSINNADSLPPYAFSPVQQLPRHDRPYDRHVGSTISLGHEPVEDTVESQPPFLHQNSLASSTADADSADSNPVDTQGSIPILPHSILKNSRTPENDPGSASSESSNPPEKPEKLISMAVRIQRAWRKHIQYRSSSATPGKSTSSLIRAGDQEWTSASKRSVQLTSASFQQQAVIGSQLYLSDEVCLPKRLKPIYDKDLPIPDEIEVEPIYDSGSRSLASISRRPGATSVDRVSLLAMAPQSQNLKLKSVFNEADHRGNAEISLRQWFAGEGAHRSHGTDSPPQSPAVVHPPEAMDSENDVSNHYTRMIRFIDRDHRRALHLRDKEMGELRERLNEKDIVYRQELRARDFLIEDLKKRLDHFGEKMEAEIERARNQVEDLWESRWKDRDFHLRERMQRMESELQKTIESIIAERDLFWSAKYEELHHRLNVRTGN